MAEDEPAPTTITKTANALAQAAEFALASLVNLGWTWPNIAFAIAAATTAATGRFPRSATILGFILFVRLIRFPEGPMSRTDQPATGEMVDLPTCATHYEWLEATTLLSEVPVVVVHGFSGDLNDVRPLAARIRDAGHRVLVYDLVGRGYSACRGERHTCRLFVSQLSELLSALQIQRAHLVGNSLGGGVAIEFARYFPQRVESLALVAPVGLRLAKRTYVLTRAPLVPDVLFRCFLQFSLLFGLEYEWADVKNPKYRTMVQAYKRRVAEEPALGRSLLSTARHFPFEQLGPAFAAAGALPRPVLVVWGDGDRTCPCAARDVRRLVPRADVVVVRGERHCVYTEFVGESARAVVDHLRRAVA